MQTLFKLKRRLCWLLFSILPKQKNKVVFQAFYGRGYSDSPRAISEALRKQGGYRLYWVIKGNTEAASLPHDVTPIKIDSMKAIFHLCTAGVWVDNARKWSFTRKGKSQLYIQTWHGFPLKRIEKDAEDALPPDYVQSAIHDSAMCDLFLSNSQYLTEIYRNSFWYNGEILEFGFPRNDTLIRGILPDEAKAISAQLNLPAEYRYLLYAPTFRKDMSFSVYDLDYARCVDALTSKFGGKWLVLAKLHPNLAARAHELNLDDRFVRNVSDYPDIQDLYQICDAMISDYSSVMFDFLNTRKPCFLYINDLEQYENDRSFYFDLTLLPYSKAKNNDELCQAIHSFSEPTHQTRIDEFIRAFGIKETGRAAQEAASWILKKRSGI